MQFSSFRTQKGVVRTNCLDCLDRTNCVQTILGIHSVKSQISSLNLESGKVNVEQRIEEILKDLWQKNGDQCSTIYAGTGALDGKNKVKILFSQFMIIAERRIPIYRTNNPKQSNG